MWVVANLLKWVPRWVKLGFGGPKVGQNESNSTLYPLYTHFGTLTKTHVWPTLRGWKLFAETGSQAVPTPRDPTKFPDFSSLSGEILSTFDHNKGQKPPISGRRLHWILFGLSSGRLIFIHLQCWEVLSFSTIQRQRCIKILCPKDPELYTPLPLNCRKGQNVAALEVNKISPPFLFGGVLCPALSIVNCYLRWSVFAVPPSFAMPRPLLKGARRLQDQRHMASVPGGSQW